MRGHHERMQRAAAVRGAEPDFVHACRQACGDVQPARGAVSGDAVVAGEIGDGFFSFILQI